LGEAQARILSAQLNEKRPERTSHRIAYVRGPQRALREDSNKALADAGEVLSRSSARAQDIENVVNSKSSSPSRSTTVRLHPAARDLHPRGRRRPGRGVGLHDRRHGGRAQGPRGGLAAPPDRRRPVRQPARRRPAARRDPRRRPTGSRTRQHARLQHRRNPQAPEGNLAIGRIEVTISNPDKLLSQESGPWNRIKGGLAVGLTALSWSLTLVVVGLCFVVPIGGSIWSAGSSTGSRKKRAAPRPRVDTNRGDDRPWHPLLRRLLENLARCYVWSEPDDKLLAFCAEKKVTRLYLMFSGKETPKLRAFVRSAKAAKIEVHAMHPGDMAEWLDPFPARLDPKPILDWVDAALKTGLFDGIHLDIEPHAAPAWKTHRLQLAAATSTCCAR
jgi:hypothetical protein